MPRKLAIVPELDEELGCLYGLPLEEFTAARNALAARLKQAGQTEAADRVRSLHKPSVPAWTANQLARRRPEELRSLVAAGARLRKAQEAALRGTGAEAVRDAAADERAAVRTLTRLGQELLDAEGRPVTQSTLERLAATLRAAIVEPETAQLLVAGRLPDEVERSGFAAVAPLAPPPERSGRRAAPARRGDAEARRKRLRKQRAEVDELERRAGQLEGQARDAERATAELRERAEHAREEARAARTRLDAEAR